MVLVERVCYEIGGLLADALIIGVVPTGITRTYMVAKGVSRFASEHALKIESLDDISENLFECLKYLD
jgi:DNA-binding transcriptional regulator YdaS (Cro superfamily)